MTSSFCNIVLETPTLGSEISLMTQAVNCAFAIASIPFIISGISGVKYEIETHLRVYLFWLRLTCVVDTVCLIWMLVMRTCANIPSILRDEGGAWACGAMRTGAIAWVVIFLSMEFYCCFVVWCRCRELALKGSEPCFDDLTRPRGARAGRAEPYNMAGLFGTGALKKEPHLISYGSIMSPVFAGSVPIFGGTIHQTAYPPPPASTSVLDGKA